MIIRALFAILAFNQVIAAPPPNATHQGCYSISLVRTNKYYEAQFLLTWEECLRFCDHRLTTHAGIQFVHSNEPDNYCYCGNDLEKHSTPADNKSCRHCLDNTDKYCGGNDSMSLYKLRDHTPLSILIPERNNGVMQYTEGYVIKSIIRHPSVYDVNYIYTEDEIYFSTFSNYYMRSVYRHDLQMFQSPEYVWLAGDIDQFTLDWTSSNTSYYYNGKEHVFVLKLNDNIKRTKLLEGSSAHRKLSIDPYVRKLFVCEDHRSFYSYDIASNSKSVLHIKNIFLTSIRFTNDVQNQLLYVTGVDGTRNNRPHLFRMKYDGSQIKELYNGPELTDLRAIDVFQDTVVWISYNNSLYTLYKCTLSPKCKTVVTLYQTVNIIVSIIIYHPEKQTPGVKFLCSQLGCSHSCEAVSLFEVKCSCPPNMSLTEDKATCVGQHFTSQESSKVHNLSSSEAAVTSENEAATIPGQHFTSQVSSNVYNRSSSEAAVTSENDTATFPGLSSNEQNIIYYRNMSLNSISYFEIVGCLAFLLNIITLTIIYFKVCKKKSDTDVTMKFSNCVQNCQENEYDQLSPNIQFNK